MRQSRQWPPASAWNKIAVKEQQSSTFTDVNQVFLTSKNFCYFLCSTWFHVSIFISFSKFIYFYFFLNIVLVCLESNASKTKCKGTASCGRTRGRQSTRSRTLGHQFPQGNLCTASLNMGTKGNLHRCTSFGTFYNIATIKSTTSGKQWRGGRQRAELVEGHSITVGSQPRRSEEMDTQCFYSRKDLGTSKLGI